MKFSNSTLKHCIHLFLLKQTFRQAQHVLSSDQQILFIGCKIIHKYQSHPINLFKKFLLYSIPASSFAFSKTWLCGWLKRRRKRIRFNSPSTANIANNIQWSGQLARNINLSFSLSILCFLKIVCGIIFRKMGRGYMSEIQQFIRRRRPPFSF